jgi:hypothetical protein
MLVVADNSGVWYWGETMDGVDGVTAEEVLKDGG